MRPVVRRSILLLLRRCLLSALFALFFETGAAQDSVYVLNYGERFTLRPFVRSNSMALEVENKIDFQRTAYRANTPVSMGMAFWWRTFGFSLSAGIPHSELRDAAPSRYFDFQYHRYGKYLNIDLYAQAYLGLYARLPEEGYTSFGDSQISRLGLRFSYLIGGHNISYCAAFEQSEQQLYPDICFPVGVGGYYQYVYSHRPKLGVERRNNPLVELYAGMMGIYPWGHYYVALEGTLGLSQNMYEDALRHAQPQYTFQGRLALGYTTKHWSLALVGYYHSLGFEETETQRYYISSMTGELSFNYRFFSFVRPLRWVDWGNRVLGW